MSKNQKKTTKFAYKPTQKLPKLGKIQTEWDLKKHYYKSENDPQIEKDAQKIEKAYSVFAKKYRGKNFTSSAKKLAFAYQDYEKLCKLVEASKISRYFGFRSTLNTKDSVANKKNNVFSQRFTKISNEITFFSLAIGKIPKNQQKKFLNDPLLSKYRYSLEFIFKKAKHHLSEPEERVLKLRRSTSRDAWEESTERIIGNRQITFNNKKYSISEALVNIDHQTWSDKQKLWDLILAEMVQISEFAEHELTAIVTHDKVSDELRGYAKPYSATVLGYENDEASVEALVQAISKKGFALSKKFYQIKAKLHGKESIPYVNKYEPIGELKSLSFSEAVKICRDGFYGIKKEYGEIFDRLISEGQTDVYPKKGKRGGAFMAGTHGLPTYVMLNHTNNFKSLETLAHEMGHAVHAEMSKTQSVLYEEFSTTTAETASTLFEQFVSKIIFKQLSDKDKILFLHDKISGDIATVQRQIAFFNFELEMHNHIRKEGAATKEELAKMMEKHLKSYLGDSVNVSERDGYCFVYVPHIRYGFYVYTYAYGHLISNLMAMRLETEPDYINKIDEFLSAGGSDTVDNIFKNADINTTKVETFLESLKTQEKEIKLLEKLTSQK